MGLLTFKAFLEANALDMVSLNMFFREEFRADADQASELVKWFTDSKDWKDLDLDARDVILGVWDPYETALPDGMSYEDLVLDEISMIMRKKYKMNSTDYL